MTNDQKKIDQLLAKLEALLQKHDAFKKEIDHLRLEINALKEDSSNEAITQDEDVFVVESESYAVTPEPVRPAPIAAAESPKSNIKTPPYNPVPKVKSDFEKFIGENLINKIGIAITVLGVAVGAKYAIDNELISPLTRIILGYLMGLGLLGFAFRLKLKYENFSAVLLSGAMAIVYFITYVAYSFYELLPQPVAFVLMVVFTAFTVFAAIQYNRAVIAHIGLVGAYAVPFLLSDGSGKVVVLFSYMGIINAGILVVAFKRYWKSLYYSSFGLTWLIYSAWYQGNYSTTEHFSLSLLFLCLYFVIFYASFLSYKLIRKEKYNKGDLVLLLLNSFIFFAIGFDILQDHDTGKHLLGLFTLINGIIHAVVSTIIYRNQQADKNLFYLAVGLVMIFTTIAVPVQLDGNWVTLLWAGEAALLFWIGRTKNVAIYEKLSYPLMLLAFFSIMHDWSVNYGNYYIDNPEGRIPFLLNINFLTSILVVLALGFINFLNYKVDIPSDFSDKRGIYKVLRYGIPAIFLIVLYNAFQVEIANYWNQKCMDSEVLVDAYERNYALEYFKNIWVLIYSIFFLAVLSLVNIERLKNRALSYANMVLNLFLLFMFLTQGLLLLSELREFYLEQTLAEYYSRGWFYIGIRYVTFSFAALLMFCIYNYVKTEFTAPVFKLAFDIIFHVTLLWVISSELINWMDIMGAAQSYKLGLSILWGLYALLLIVLGIVKRKKHLRIGAMALFGITLVKLFFYDIASLDTIAKTIVFVSLGILLLIISFLYNKYKHIISDEVEN